MHVDTVVQCAEPLRPTCEVRSHITVTVVTVTVLLDHSAR